MLIFPDVASLHPIPSTFPLLFCALHRPLIPQTSRRASREALGLRAGGPGRSRGP